MAKKRTAGKKRTASAKAAGKSAGKDMQNNSYKHNPNDVIARLDRLHENRQTEFAKPSYKIIYWTSLLVLLICNFIISMVLIPFILVLSSFKFYILIILLGFIFGFLFNILINDIEHIELKHHAFAIILIPLVAVVNIFLMLGLANSFAKLLKIYTYHDAVLPALVYSIVFVLPYIFSVVKRYGIKAPKKQ